MTIAPYAEELAAHGITFQADVSYLGADRKEKLDLYLPPASFERPLPAVLLIHGGGWRIGDKAAERERNIGANLAANGYAVFSVNYELNVGEKEGGEEAPMKLTHIAWPQNFYDCKTALRYIRHEAKGLGIDPERIAVMGGSAGGHLSMLLGATQHRAEYNGGGAYTEQSNAVKCVIDFYGPPDVRGKREGLFTLSTDPAEKARVGSEASPVLLFDETFPPMLIAHGTSDTIIPVEVSRELAEMLRQKGLEYWYVEIFGAPHTFHLQPEAMDLRPVVLGFLKRHLG
jgi:acetyl esterase/lipase